MGLKEIIGSEARMFLDESAAAGREFDLPLHLGAFTTVISAKLCGFLEDYAYFVTSTDLANLLEKSGEKDFDEVRFRASERESFYEFVSEAYPLEIDPSIVRKLGRNIKVPSNVLNSIAENNVLRVPLPDRIINYERDSDRVTIKENDLYIKISTLNRNLKGQQWGIDQKILTPQENVEIEKVLARRQGKTLEIYPLFEELFDVLKRKRSFVHGIEESKKPLVEVFPYIPFEDKKISRTETEPRQKIFTMFKSGVLMQLSGSMQLEASRYTLEKYQRPFYLSDPSDPAQMEDTFSAWLDYKSEKKGISRKSLFSDFYEKNESIRQYLLNGDSKVGMPPFDTSNWGNIPLLGHKLFGHVHLTGIEERDFDALSMLVDAYTVLMMNTEEFETSKEGLPVHDISLNGMSFIADAGNTIPIEANLTGVLSIPKGIYSSKKANSVISVDLYVKGKRDNYAKGKREKDGREIVGCEYFLNDKEMAVISDLLKNYHSG